MMQGWRKMLAIDLADVSIIETYRRVRFGINSISPASQIVTPLANSFLEPLYQKGTQFHQACLFDMASFLPIYPIVDLK